MTSNNLHYLTREQKKVLFLSSLGGMLEFYDFIVYIFLANVIEKLFFLEGSAFIITLKTFAIFSIGYLLRPLGGVIFSHFGDRYGRKVVFIVTILLMAIPSFAIALLPTATHIGIMAPILLLIFRMMQGLALGGEIPGAITFVSEHVTEKRTGFATATLFLGINLGLLLGSLVTATVSSLFTTEALYTYGWRIPFFIGGIFGIISVFLRSYLKETAAFAALPKNHINRIPLIALLKSSWLTVLQSALLVGLASVTVFLYLYFPHYLHQHKGFKLESVLTINTICIMVFSLTILFAGQLADRFGFRLIYSIGALLLVLLTYPLFLLFGMHSIFLLIISYIIFSIIFGLITGSYPAILSTLFETPVRYSGIATSYNLAFALFGGLSPIICTLAIYYFHSDLAPAFYLILVAFVSLLVVFILPI